MSRMRHAPRGRAARRARAAGLYSRVRALSACGGHSSLTDRICDVCGADLSRDQPPGDSYEALSRSCCARTRNAVSVTVRCLGQFGARRGAAPRLGVNAYRSRAGAPRSSNAFRTPQLRSARGAARSPRRTTLASGSSAREQPKRGDRRRTSRTASSSISAELPAELSHRARGIPPPRAW